jgi:hypothetical protein
MRSHDLSDLTVYPATLVPLDPTKGGSETPSARVGIGGPITLPYSASDEDDPKLSAFISADHTHAYHLLLLRCTFDAPENEPFVEALVRFRLSCTPGAADDPPIGWDAIPERATSDEGTRSTTTSMAPKAAVLGVSAEAFSRTTITTRDVTQVYAEIRGLLTPTPRWKLRRTPTRPLSGDEPLSLVVRAPLQPVAVEIEVKASIAQRHLGLVPYRVEVPAGSAKLLIAPPAAIETG